MRLSIIILLTIGSFDQAHGQVATALRRPTDTLPSFVAGDGPQPGTPRTLKALVIAPSLGLSYDGSEVTPIPSIHAQGDKFLLGSENSNSSLLTQIRFDFNTRPAAGRSEDVASRIKLAPGSANLDIGVRGSWFEEAKDADEGSLGIDFRGGITAAYQTGDSAMADAELTTSRFALFSGQATVAVWLWYLYVGGQANYYVATGDSDIAKEISRSAGFSGTAILPLKSGAGADERAYFVQFSVGGDSNNTTSAFTFTALFSPL